MITFTNICIATYVIKIFKRPNWKKYIAGLKFQIKTVKFHCHTKYIQLSRNIPRIGLAIRVKIFKNWPIIKNRIMSFIYQNSSISICNLWKVSYFVHESLVFLHTFATHGTFLTWRWRRWRICIKTPNFQHHSHSRTLSIYHPKAFVFGHISFGKSLILGKLRKCLTHCKLKALFLEMLPPIFGQICMLSSKDPYCLLVPSLWILRVHEYKLYPKTTP